MKIGRNADFIPTPGWQTEFLRSNAYALCVTGESGGGRTTALLVDAAKTIGVGYGPAHNAIVLVPTREMIKPILVEASEKLYPALGGTFDGQRWSFPEGERIWFDSANDPRKWQGACFSWVGFDEIQDVDREDFSAFASRLRSVGKSPPLRLRATRTPQDWIAETFDTVRCAMGIDGVDYVKAMSDKRCAKPAGWDAIARANQSEADRMLAGMKGDG